MLSDYVISLQKSGNVYRFTTADLLASWINDIVLGFSSCAVPVTDADFLTTYHNVVALITTPPL